VEAELNPYSSPRMATDASLPTRLSRQCVLVGLLISSLVFGLFATFSAVLVFCVSTWMEINVRNATPFPLTIPVLGQLVEGFCFYAGFGLVASSLAAPVLLFLNSRHSLRTVTAFGVMIVLGVTAYLLVLLLGPRLTPASIGGFNRWTATALLNAVIVLLPSAIAALAYAAWIDRKRRGRAK
jgi:hypothetical protein